ncbi:hypothetical protein DOT66_23640 [Ralstonia pseudosolanacearum]|uniref:KAP family P-loop NTPase fold protein n=1 Tax=Ralstonia pseudosolanacearum TaxID=1310165 RepID=UPI000DAC3B39|nr:P-loop NTPase fold protein [Ralstonia pseudosolanacearum]RAA04933.1 hypothetical protein DOT66_23640 [Ralstonia pseudosolanacearum]
MTANPPPLALPADPLEDIATPFEGDLLNRAALALRLTNYVDRLRCGAVLAIDAQWGEGKSWFARHWAALLRQDGHRVGFVDAFQQDYVEDPFLLLAAEIRRLCAGNASVRKRFVDKAAGVGSALLPVATKAAINLAGKLAGTTDLTDEFAEAIKTGSKTGGDAAQAWVKRKLEDHAKEQGSVKAFREELIRFAGASDKPVVVFVDELDRCRPAFAVRLVERIKHFFDVPNLVFVLVMNREQLEKAIKGVYGAETDAATYLGKFLHLSLRLPKNASRQVSYEEQHPTKLFVDAVLRRYGLPGGAISGFAHAFAVCAVIYGLSLRDIERGCALYVLAERNWPGLLAYLIALKLRRPVWFAGVRDRDFGVHEEAKTRLSDEIRRLTLSGESDEWLQAYLNTLIALHELAINGESQAVRQMLQENWDYLYANGPHPPSTAAFSRAVMRLDLDVEA